MAIVPWIGSRIRIAPLSWVPHFSRQICAAEEVRARDERISPPMHIAILHNLDADYLEEDPGREARKDVAKVADSLAAALDQGTLRPRLVPVSGASDLLAALEGAPPDLVINLCESLAADSRGEMA